MGRRRARSPLPQQEGLDAVRVRTPARVGDTPAPFATLRDFLLERLPPHVPVDAWLAAGRFVDATGTPLTDQTPYTPATLVWFHKDLRPEPEPEPETGPLPILHRDDRIVVIDKPHFVASIPRGRHIQASALVRLRRQLALPDLAPAHRLDRLTAGVLVFTVEPRWRPLYQGLFAAQETTKTYEAIAPALPGLTTPIVVSSHITKQRGRTQVVQRPATPATGPNATTRITRVTTRGPWARYLLEPATGRTHQLRAHLAGLGAPIAGDPLYPIDRTAGASDNPADPLRLLARSLSFVDPVDGGTRTFTSTRTLTWPDDPRARPTPRPDAPR